MIDELKSKIKELDKKKQALTPKLEEIEKKRSEALAEVNKKYDHLVADANIEVTQFEQKIMNDLLRLYSKTIMNEFDQKRSTSEYVLTDNFKEYRKSFAEIDMFPKELIEKMDKVIDGGPIEIIAYELDKIEQRYKK